jgi:hypothetical protein
MVMYQDQDPCVLQFVRVAHDAYVRFAEGVGRVWMELMRMDLSRQKNGTRAHSVRWIVLPKGRGRSKDRHKFGKCSRLYENTVPTFDCAEQTHMNRNNRGAYGISLGVKPTPRTAAALNLE